MARLARNLALILMTAALGGCNGGGRSDSSQLQKGPARVPSASPTPTPAPLPRLRACTDAGGAYLCRSLSAGTAALRFQSQGMTYTHGSRLESGTDVHDIFMPGLFNEAVVRRDFADIAAHGYNTVRLFLVPLGRVTLSDGTVTNGIAAADDSTTDVHLGLHVPYIINVIQTVRVARDHGLYVQLVVTDVPASTHYASVVDPSPVSSAPCGAPMLTAAGNNVFYLERNAIHARALYIANFLRYFQRLAPELVTTLALLEVDNDSSLDLLQAPYSATTGFFRGPDDVCYDMSDATQRQQVADAAIVRFANAMVEAVRLVDPNMLTTISLSTFLSAGFSAPNGYLMPGDHTYYGPGDGVYLAPFSAAALTGQSTIPVLSLHLYPYRIPGETYDLAADLASLPLTSLAAHRPAKVLMTGEFGALTSGMTADEHSRAPLAMRTLLDQLIGTYGLESWSYRTWNSNLPLTLSAVADEYAISDALTGAAAPTVAPAGPFRVGMDLYRSDGIRVYCRYRTLADFQLANGALEPARLTLYRKFPAAMTDGAPCPVP